MAQDLSITVNSQSHQVQAQSETPLLYVLRNELNLNGPRFGCGLGQCGACAVHVDDRVVFSCVTPVGEVSGAEVTTLEGLGGSENPSPVQQAFIDEQAAQCGFCINGMVMTASALLMANPNPNEDEIRGALTTNLCRCGTHIEILKAVRKAVDEAD